MIHAINEEIKEKSKEDSLQLTFNLINVEKAFTFNLMHRSLTITTTCSFEHHILREYKPYPVIVNIS